MGFTLNKKKFFETISIFRSIFPNIYPLPPDKNSCGYDFWKEKEANVRIYDSFSFAFFVFIARRLEFKAQNDFKTLICILIFEYYM